MACKNQTERPQKRTQDIVEHKFLFIHRYNSGHNWRKSPKNWKKTRKNNRSSAVFFKEIFRLDKVFFLKPKTIFLIVQIITAFRPEPIAYHVSKDSGHSHQA